MIPFKSRISSRGVTCWVVGVYVDEGMTGVQACPSDWKWPFKHIDTFLKNLERSNLFAIQAVCDFGY